mgnify:CR=1 FL=1
MVYKYILFEIRCDYCGRLLRCQTQRPAEKQHFCSLKCHAAWDRDQKARRELICHDCEHWQDGDEGPCCEYADNPPCDSFG